MLASPGLFTFGIKNPKEFFLKIAYSPQVFRAWDDKVMKYWSLA